MSTRVDPTSSHAPILCLDTCAILDVIRDPARNDVYADHQEASLALLLEAESGLNLVAVVTDLVRSEFSERVDHVQEESARSIRRMREHIDKLDRLAALHGSPGKSNTEHWEGHVTRCRGVAERWLSVSAVASQTEQTELAAYRRAKELRSPARKGKESLADCTIIETYLDHIRKLRHSGVMSPVVFVSSNTRDYTDQLRGGLRDDIRNEFAAIDVEYAPNMGAARHKLGL